MSNKSQKQISELRIRSQQRQQEVNNRVQQQQSIGARTCSCILGEERYKALSERCAANVDLFAGIFHLSCNFVMFILGLGIFFTGIALKYSTSTEELWAALGLGK